MTSATVYHPGLTFATLVVQFVMAQAASLPSLARRRGGVKKGGGDPEDPDPAPSPNPSPPSTTPPTPKTSSSSNSSPSSTSQSGANSVTTSSGPSSSITSSSTSASSSSSSSTSPTPTVGPVVLSTNHSKISTPGIVGAAIGSVIIAGLICMLLARCIHRHKARNRPRGFLPLTSFFAPAPRAQSPTTEMSQTQSSPLISSAVAAGATSSPNPIFTRFSRSFSTSGTSSLSPLMPAASLQHSHSIGSSSGQSTIHTRATADLEILQTPPGSPHSAGLLPIISAAANGSASTSRAMEPESSPLHRSMTLHQKALEADSKGHDDVGTMEIDKVEGVNDPPPGYND